MARSVPMVIGTVDGGGETKRDSRAEAERGGDALKRGANGGGSLDGGGETQATEIPPAAEAAHGERKDADEPEAVDPREAERQA